MKGDVISMDLGGGYGIMVISVHPHDPPNPSVPPLLAATKPSGLQLNGFRGNSNADCLPNLDCVVDRMRSQPTHAQVRSISDTNPQGGPAESFRPGDDDPRKYISKAWRLSRFIGGNVPSVAISVLPFS